MWFKYVACLRFGRKRTSYIIPTPNDLSRIDILNDAEVKICCSRKYLSLRLYFQSDWMWFTAGTRPTNQLLSTFGFLDSVWDRAASPSSQLKLGSPAVDIWPPSPSQTRGGSGSASSPPGRTQSLPHGPSNYPDRTGKDVKEQKTAYF